MKDTPPIRRLLRQRKFSYADSTLQSVPESCFTNGHDAFKERDSPKRIRAATPVLKKHRSISVDVRPFGFTRDRDVSLGFFERFDSNFSSPKVAVGRKTSIAFQKRPRRCSEVNSILSVFFYNFFTFAL